MRVAAMTFVLLVLYAITPVAGRTDTGALIGLFAALAAFLVLVAWQIRAIVNAPHPELRALQTVLVALVILLIVFAFAYLSIAQSDPGSFSEHLSRVAAFYFTVSTFSTVGFGDVAARSDAARVIVTIQMLLDLAVIAGAARLVIVAVRVGLQRHETAKGSPS